MAIDAFTTFTNTNNVAFPDTESINASGPTATDGTEFVKVMVDNYMFGPQQALLNHAGLIPDGVPEADGTSQELEALKRSFGNAGEEVNWYGDADPATLNLKLLLLEGQGVLIANYQELTDVVYVGDGNNGTAPAFYKADDAAGTIRNIAGIYLILPDATDIYPRFVGESLYSAKVENNSTATLISENVSFIQSVTRTGLGFVDVVFNTSFFNGVIPSVTVTVNAASGGLTVGTISALTAAGFTFQSREAVDPGYVLKDFDFEVKVQRQDTDYTIYPSDFIKAAIRY